MSAPTQTQQTAALAQRSGLYNQFRGLLAREDVQERFRQILDKRSTEFVASLLSLVSADRNLLECDPATILTAAAKAAILRLPIAKELGYAYIVPFKREATFIIGYKGIVQLAIRTSQYYNINATPIYEGERVEVDRLTGIVKITGERTGDKITGYVSYFKLKNGFEKYLYMDRDSVARHAEKYSKSWGNAKSAWTTNFDEMALKTVIRQLLSKWGLLSIDMQDADDIPVMGDDARIVPRFENTPQLSGDNPLEGEFKPEPEPESTNDQAPVQAAQPEQQPAAPAPETGKDGENPQQPVDIFQAVTDAGLAENAHAAKSALEKYCKTGFDTPEKAIAWMRLYRAWRDLGGKPDTCADKANTGQVPA